MGPEAIRQSRHTVLWSLHPEFYPALHAGLNVPSATRYWRTRGRFISGAELEAVLTGGVAHCMVVTTRSDHQPIGLVELLDHQAVERRGQISVVSWVSDIRKSLLIEAVVIAMDEWFARFELRTLHVMAASPAMRGFQRTLDDMFQRDGILRDYLSVEGMLFDVEVYSILREEYIDRIRSSAFLQQLSDHWRTNNSEEFTFSIPG